jgi:diguanylate cyclase (GGDEF)-like protein/PAS domain S-box-containing protein
MSRLSNLLFPQSPLAIIIVDSESLKISEANPAAGRLFHHDPLDFQDTPLKNICAFGEFSRLKEVLHRGAGPHAISIKLLRKDDQPFHAEMRASLLDSGGEHEWLLYVRDISSELEAREALRRSEREYRRMVENSPDGIALIQDGIVVFANMACEKILGLKTPDELWASEFESFVHPDDLELWRLREKTLLAGSTLARCEIRLVRPDGNSTDVELAQDLMERPEGKAMQATLRDITERKKMERKITESEERYKGLASVAFDGVAVHFEGILLQANRSFESIFGYGEGDTQGRSIYDLVAEEQREYFKRELESGNVLELEGLRADGQHVHIEASTRACSFMGEPAYVMAVRDISNRKNAEQAIRHQAYFDGLTGLPNRLLFFDRLSVAVEQASRDKRIMAVMFLDLDRFKNVNDSLGHNVGDLLLFEAAERLSACLRKGDTVSRLGGDEFTILLNEISEPQDAALVAEKIIKAINDPYLIQDQSINIGISIGIALFPEHAQTADNLIKAADAAMYIAKDNGRNNCQLYAPDKAGKRDKLGLETRLRKGIEDKEFTVYYQPKVDLKTGRLAGAEALVRWQHPQRGLVMPDDFIPMAEETRLIIPLGEWVLNEACRQAKQWEKAGIKISVNLSPWQLHKTSLIETVDQALKGSGVDPASIELEITETAAMKNPGQTLSVLRDLTSRGLSVSLDDFGKGYSSLNYLKQFPVSTIKIDMAFIRDLLSEPKDAAIVRAIILLGHNLKMKLLAEGVENPQQAEFLKHEGCDLAQGYLYSRPVPAENFEKLFATL